MYPEEYEDFTEWMTDSNLVSEELKEIEASQSQAENELVQERGAK